MTFIAADGASRTVGAPVGAPVGRSLKDVALDGRIDGIIGERGGFAACGTCHTYVEDGWLAHLPRPAADEARMLEGVVDGRPNSRLACQIEVTPGLDGLVVRVPSRQY